METKTIEQQVAETILQQSGEVKIGEETYQVAPPTAGTLILVSGLIAQLPAIKLDSDNIVVESLCIAKDCRIIGEIVAALILGAKNIKEVAETPQKSFWNLFQKSKKAENQKTLAEKIINNLSPQALQQLMTELLKRMQIDYFFYTTTSLLEINLLKQTREVEKMTAFGRS